MNPQFNSFKKQITHPIKYRLFMLSKLPMGFISGLKIEHLSVEQSSISVKFMWVNQNPFRSIYFAVLSMAAELSTGLLSFGQIYKRQSQVSMLVIKCEATFLKKATGKIIFTCNDGNKIENAIEQTLTTGEGVIIQAASIGKNNNDEDVAKFLFTWSFKAKK